MSRTFIVTIPPGDTEYLDNVRRSAEGMGAVFEGDMTGGTFTGRGIKGQYDISGDTITVTIIDKPAIAPWPVIEALVKDFFE